MIVKLTVFFKDQDQSKDFILDIDQISDTMIKGPAIESSNVNADIDYDSDPLTFFWNNPNKDHFVETMEPI